MPGWMVQGELNTSRKKEANESEERKTRREENKKRKKERKEDEWVGANTINKW